MAVTSMFDAVFVNQLFGTDARGETVFYPNCSSSTARAS